MVCDLDNAAKQTLCDEAMYRMILFRDGDVFGSFADSSDLPVPAIAKSADLFKCKNLPIKDAGIKMPMYWCSARRYNKKWELAELGPTYRSSPDSSLESKADSSSDSEDESLEQRVVRGFFLAGSNYDKRRAYGFKAPEPDEKTSKVKMWLQLDRFRPQ